MRNMFSKGFWIIPLIAITLILSSCGKVAKETGSDGGSSSGGGTTPPPPPPPSNYTLTIVVSPNSSYGSVTTSPNGTTFASGTTVNLTASAGSGYMFDSWSGDLTGSSNVSVITMDSNKTITAEFVTAPPVQYPLNTSIVGNGSITKTPSQALYNAGDTVQLQANADSGWVFDDWSGDLPGGSSNPANVEMNGTKNITATFKQLFTLTTIVSPSAAGSISPANGSTHKDGTTITVEAANNSGYTFSHWEGDLTGAGTSKSLLMNSNKSVTAVFNQVLTYALNTSVSPVGAGSITKTPNQSDYTANTSVQVQANANSGYVFSHWSGDLTGSTNPTNITMDTTKNITAVFIEQKYIMIPQALKNGDGTYSCNLSPAPNKTETFVHYYNGSPYDMYRYYYNINTDVAVTMVSGTKVVDYWWVTDNVTLSESGPGWQGIPDVNPLNVNVSKNFHIGGLTFKPPTWQNVGSAGFSNAIQGNPTMVFNGSDIYVAFQDASLSNKATVMKYNGSSWSTVGSAGFSDGQADWLTIANNGGTIYVAYRDVANSNKATVKQYNGSSWVTVGTQGWSDGQVESVGLDFNGSTPTVIYRDSVLNPSDCARAFFNGSIWTGGGSAYVGNTPNSGGFRCALAIYNSEAYVAYIDSDNSNKLTVKKFNGSSWVLVGSAGFSPAITRTDIAFKISTSGTPYVVFADSTKSNKATVMKHNGSSWVNVGSTGFSTCEETFTLGLDGDTPYIAYTDQNNGSKATVMKYNGSSWETVGSYGFTSGQSWAPLIVINNGIPYIAYQDGANSNKVTVMKYSY